MFQTTPNRNVSENTTKEPKEFLEEVIEVYKDNACLWQTNHPQYRNKLQRDKALDKIVLLLRRRDPKANRITAKKKIELLRQRARDNLDALKKSSISLKDYPPNKYWFARKLHFIWDQFEMGKTTSIADFVNITPSTSGETVNQIDVSDDSADIDINYSPLNEQSVFRNMTDFNKPQCDEMETKHSQKSFETSLKKLLDRNVSENTTKEPKEFLEEIIEVYKDNACLWQRTHPKYKNKLERDKALDKIVPLLRKRNPKADRTTAKNKINLLRQRVRDNLDLLKKSTTSLKDYPPNKYWYARKMHFIWDQFEMGKKTSIADSVNITPSTSGETFKPVNGAPTPCIQTVESIGNIRNSETIDISEDSADIGIDYSPTNDQLIFRNMIDFNKPQCDEMETKHSQRSFEISMIKLLDGNDSENMTKEPKEFLEAIIEVYKDNTCLWQTTHPKYKNKIERDKALDKIVLILRRRDPKADRNTAKKKIHILRQRAINNLYGLKKSSTSLKDYPPNKYWYARKMHFIWDQFETSRTTSIVDFSDDSADIAMKNSPLNDQLIFRNMIDGNQPQSDEMETKDSQQSFETSLKKSLDGNVFENTAKELKELLEEIIEVYKDNACLWQTTHPQYKNKVERDKALDKIVLLLRRRDPKADRIIAKNKIHLLRQRARNNLDMLKKNSKSLKDYPPNKYWYARKMHFIWDQFEMGKKTSISDFVNITPSTSGETFKVVNGAPTPCLQTVESIENMLDSETIDISDDSADMGFGFDETDSFNLLEEAKDKESFADFIVKEMKNLRPDVARICEVIFTGVINAAHADRVNPDTIMNIFKVLHNPNQ